MNAQMDLFGVPAVAAPAPRPAANQPPAAPLDPVLKWAGGKRWLVPTLRDLYAPHRDCRLVEPFVGGMAVALGLQPSRALLNDANPYLVGLYRHMALGFTVPGAVPLLNDATTYYANRERFNALRLQTGVSAEAAGLFYYLNRTGFNGLCRFNRSGGYNVPFGKYASINYRRDFTAYAPVLSRWEIVCGDFSAVPVLPGDYLYADPPYDGTFTDYAAGGFDWCAQERLAAWLARHDGPVVTSNAATPRILALYEGLGFAIQTVQAPRRISCDGDREAVGEMLATRGTGAL